MPRMNLTDEEAQAVLALRQRNAVRDARNEGIREAIVVVSEYRPDTRETVDYALGRILDILKSRMRT